MPQRFEMYRRYRSDSAYEADSRWLALEGWKIAGRASSAEPTRPRPFHLPGHRRRIIDVHYVSDP